MTSRRALTVWANHSTAMLRKVAEEIGLEIRKIENISESR
jgi:hypothetical protein